MLRIVRKDNLVSSPGDFGIEVVGGDLCVSKTLGSALSRMGIVTGEEFFSVLSSYPEAFADLQPSKKNLTKAANVALGRLRPAVADSFSDIDREAQRSVGFGVPQPRG